MQELLDANESVRRKAAEELIERATNSTTEIASKIPELVAFIRESTDDMVSMQIAHAISIMCEKSPGVERTYSGNIMGILEFLSSRPMTEDESETMINAVATHLLNTQVPQLTSDSSFLRGSLPLLFKYLKKEGSARWPAYTVVARVAAQNPKMFEDYVGVIIEMVAGGSSELSPSLMFLYKFKPVEYHSRIDTLAQVYQKDTNLQSLLLSIFLEISKDRPELLEPHLGMFVEGLNSPTTGSMNATIMSEIARSNPGAVYPHLDSLKESVNYVDALKYTVPNVLGLIGRMSDDVAREVLPFLAELLKDADQNLAIMVLSEFRNLGEMNRELIEPYMDLIRTCANDPQKYVRDQANSIIDYMEGRDLRTLAFQIEQQNTLIREAALTVGSLKEYVDQNVEMLKYFIADIVKKLPVPVKFSIEGRIRKTLELHFTCGLQHERCLYPEDRSFITETKAWNKWLKIAMSAVRIGRSIIFPIESGDAVDAVREAYDAYKEKDDKDFLAYISEPFLTSEEQDKLVSQLREARFFDVFNYVPETGEWACLMCNPSA
ncbi:MAG: hypothetical protein ACXABM_03725 [Candidatus Thorarchaeota archaeon]|jgi:hypothetical protein